MEGAEKEAFWKAVQCTVEKDVVRTDRCHPYFTGEGNPNIDILKYVLSCLLFVSAYMSDLLLYGDSSH